MVGTQADDILNGADKEDVLLLIVGDPFGCILHSSAYAHDILTGITVWRPTSTSYSMHAPAISPFAWSTMLQSWAWLAHADYSYTTLDRQSHSCSLLNLTWGLGSLMLVLLDIKVKELNEENLVRFVEFGICEFHPDTSGKWQAGRYMNS